MRLRPSNGRFEIRNARFVDIRNNRYYRPGTALIINGGRIESIIDRNSDSSPPCDTVVDLGGKTVLPGLFNTHCHIQITLPAVLAGIGDMISNRVWAGRQLEKNMEDCLLYGVLNIRDALTDDLRPNRLLKSRIEAGSLPGPRIWDSILIGPENGNFTTRRSFLQRMAFTMRNMPTLDFSSPFSGMVTFPPHAGRAEIRRAVDCAIERGARYIKIYEQKRDWFTGNFDARFMTREQLDTLVDYAHFRGIRTTVHQVSLESFRRALEAGVGSFAHLPGDGLLEDRDIRRFLGAGAVLEPTATAMYHLCWRIRGDDAANHENMLGLTEYRDKTFLEASAPFWLEPLYKRLARGFGRLNSGRFRLAGLFDVSPLFRVYARSAIICAENLKRLYGAGAPLGCGNDAGAVSATEAMTSQELELINLFLGFGSDGLSLSGADALKAATLNSARAMGLDNDFGSIDVNKVADLVIIDGDPLRDRSVIGKKACTVYMAGRLAVHDGRLVRGARS